MILKILEFFKSSCKHEWIMKSETFINTEMETHECDAWHCDNFLIKEECIHCETTRKRIRKELA